jgi:hypothetical protein
VELAKPQFTTKLQQEWQQQQEQEQQQRETAELAKQNGGLPPKMAAAGAAGDDDGDDEQRATTIRITMPGKRKVGTADTRFAATTATAGVLHHCKLLASLPAEPKLQGCRKHLQLLRCCVLHAILLLPLLPLLLSVTPFHQHSALKSRLSIPLNLTTWLNLNTSVRQCHPSLLCLPH